MLFNIFSSASKIVFILLAIALIVLTFIGKVDPKDFIVLTTGVFSYYFGRKNDTMKPVENNLAEQG